MLQNYTKIHWLFFSYVFLRTWMAEQKNNAFVHYSLASFFDENL